MASRLAAFAWKVEPRLDPERAVASRDHLFVWDERATGGPTSTWFVGLGAAVTIDAKGHARFDEVRRQARESFERIDARGDARPRFVGAFSFEPGGSADAAWARFGDASFVIPRLVLEAKEGEVVATFVGEISQVDGLVASQEARGDLVRAMLEEPGDDVAARVSETASHVVSFPSASFIEMVGSALEAIEGGALDKIVVSARTRVESSGRPDPAKVLARLAGKAATVRFAIGRGDVTFVGASPERLVSVRDGRAETDALAGSLPRRGDDAAEIAALLASDKDAREHAWVVRAITDALGPLSLSLDVPGEPAIRSLRHVHHLLTPISAKLADERHVVELVGALHPTPAMSGWPLAKARTAIREIEGVSRGLYASPIGWFDARGEGSFVVAIRSALLDATGAWVFAGAGVVRGSVPRAEWEETRAKSSQMLEALGAS